MNSRFRGTAPLGSVAAVGANQSTPGQSSPPRSGTRPTRPAWNSAALIAATGYFSYPSVAVILDSDLATALGMETKRLNERDPAQCRFGR